MAKIIQLKNKNTEVSFGKYRTGNHYIQVFIKDNEETRSSKSLIDTLGNDNELREFARVILAEVGE